MEKRTQSTPPDLMGVPERVSSHSSSVSSSKASKKKKKKKAGWLHKMNPFTNRRSASSVPASVAATPGFGGEGGRGRSNTESNTESGRRVRGNRSGAGMAGATGGVGESSPQSDPYYLLNPPHLRSVAASPKVNEEGGGINSGRHDKGKFRHLGLDVDRTAASDPVGPEDERSGLSPMQVSNIINSQSFTNFSSMNQQQRHSRKTSMAGDLMGGNVNLLKSKAKRSMSDVGPPGDVNLAARDAYR